mmetsp:Transcript_18123/g.30272  ORF Transcript_18123/g.30272 Transcript_18123/m.30272 type:complete len:224 (-) Transcript_18123:105-776(-)
MGLRRGMPRSRAPSPGSPTTFSPSKTLEWARPMVIRLTSSCEQYPLIMMSGDGKSASRPTIATPRVINTEYRSIATPGPWGRMNAPAAACTASCTVSRLLQSVLTSASAAWRMGGSSGCLHTTTLASRPTRAAQMICASAATSAAPACSRLAEIAARPAPPCSASSRNMYACTTARTPQAPPACWRRPQRKPFSRNVKPCFAHDSGKSRSPPNSVRWRSITNS